MISREATDMIVVHHLDDSRLQFGHIANMLHEIGLFVVLHAFDSFGPGAWNARKEWGPFSATTQAYSWNFAAGGRRQWMTSMSAVRSRVQRQHFQITSIRQPNG
jgi:hypothetical protein